MKKIIIIMLALIAFVTVPLISFGLMNYDKVHYRGETILTPEQYINISLYNEISDIVTYQRESVDDGLIKLTYDFYIESDSPQFAYLDTVNGGIFDISYIYVPFQAFKQEPWLWAVVVAMITAYVAGSYISAVSKNNPIKRFIIKQAKRVNSWYYKDIQNTNGLIIEEARQIDIEGNSGIIGIRSWGLNNKGELLSTGNFLNTWDKKEQIADKVPDKNNGNGLYAFRVGAPKVFEGHVMGIVALDGKYEYHADGVIRGEHCKILGFFMSHANRKLGNFISQRYQVPVCYDEKPIAGYFKWLCSDKGIKAMKHNYAVLEGN